MDHNKRIIAYIAPEIPGLSATFVYNEITALEKKGYIIVPISIHVPMEPAIEMKSLTERTYYLYSEGTMVFLWSFLMTIMCRPKLLSKGLFWLVTDFISIGIFKKDAWKLFFHFLAACRLVKRLKAINCEHIHIHFADTPTQVGMYASALTNIPYSVTSHANDIFEHGRLLKNKAIRSKCFVTISEFNRNYLISQGVPKEKIVVVRCGIKLNNKLKHKKIYDHMFRIGSLGRLVEKKGMSILLHAARKIIDQNINIEVIIAGDGPLKEELQALKESLALNQNVTFIGALPHASVPEWLNEIDAFVLACQKDSRGDMDGIPVALMEAMSQKVPVISTRISGIPELIIHKKTGLLSEPDDPNNLADQIIKLIKNQNLSEELAKNGMEYVFTEFSEETNIKRLEHCFL